MASGTAASPDSAGLGAPAGRGAYAGPAHDDTSVLPAATADSRKKLLLSMLMMSSKTATRVAYFGAGPLLMMYSFSCRG